MMTHDRPMERCEPCTGRGYRGRWRVSMRHGSVWKLETCRACGGTGQRPPKAPRGKQRS